jgi:hypothetical protein
LEEFPDVMPDELPENLPPKRRVDHAIEVMPGVEPPAKAPYRMSHEELKELKVQLEELLTKGYIKPSKSPYGAPVLFVHMRRRVYYMGDGVGIPRVRAVVSLVVRSARGLS